MKAKISAVAAEYLATGDDERVESPGQYEVGLAALTLEANDPMTKQMKNDIHMQIAAMRSLKKNAPPCINCALCVVRYCALTGAMCDKFIEYTENGLEEMSQIRKTLYEIHVQETE